MQTDFECPEKSAQRWEKGTEEETCQKSVLFADNSECFDYSIEKVHSRSKWSSQKWD